MKTGKLFNCIIALLMITTSFLGMSSPAEAMPMSAVDETQVPHYFGPYPNWANSPFTLSDATVQITGDGAGAQAVATVGGNGAITGITLTNAGVGYTTAAVNILSTNGTGAAATAAVTLTGSVTSIAVNTPGSGYSNPVVTLTGGSAAVGALVNVGNQLIPRQFATDSIAAPGKLGRVFVVVPTEMPVKGYVENIQYFNQAMPGDSPTASEGNLFHAYILRPIGTSGQYSVLWDSGEQTVPAAVNPEGDIVTIPVPKISVTTGDTIAFYGEGIPVDSGSGLDIQSSAPRSAPAKGASVTLGGNDFSLISDNRTYSIAANVVDLSVITPDAVVDATATAYGSVDSLTLTNAGSGYTFPTVDFDMPDDPAGTQATGYITWDAGTGSITGIVINNPGSGYAHAPNVIIRDGTLSDPINGGTGATAVATISISNINVDTFGSGYVVAPTVTITDSLGGTGTGATATAFVSAGGVTSITLTAPGVGYNTQGGIKKFQDGLPVLCIPGIGQTFADCTDNNLGQHIPVAVPDTTTFSIANGFTTDADYYVIAVVQHREQMSSSLPASGTLLREYVQLETPANAAFSKHVALQTDLKDGTSVPTLMPDGSQAYAVDDPHYLGPIISATKDRAVRIVFYNLLPTGAEGDLFLPVDSSMMGSGMGPMNMMAAVDEGTVLDMVRNPECTSNPKGPMCFKDNRATLHLHGGITPWISDGTPHQWITPANEATDWPQGVTVESVPDMAPVAGVPDCTLETDGCMTFFYTNQQSARLMFYHDHAWGITRLNVYAGEAAGYIITDDTEKKLIADGTIPGAADTIPLIIQDRTFVPDTAQLAEADPTWDSARWGGYGNLWYHHVYMPAQNPGDPGGMSAYGRWMYGPWFWPPASPMHGPIANPYYNMDPATNFSTPLAVPCNLDDPATWQYQTDPFCEPEFIPGTPNISVGMEQFNDTPLVNGTVYPTTTLQPKTYRLRILNAANDRFWNLQWYVADPTTGTDSEVALNAAELAAAQTDPNVFPTPDTTLSPAGPSWIQIGNEGGFLPAPTVVPNQPITWITDPTRFDVGNVDLHSLLLAPAERADVIVDFSKYAGKTLILYNDAPAAFPARVPSYDYYTGVSDMSPNGAPAVLPGYGPNTRTIMQVKIAAAAPAAAYNLSKLQAAFRHHADGSGVFESGQHPIIVGQAAYNSAYGTNFASSSWCNAPGSTTTRCDGYARIQEQGGFDFAFNTLKSPNAKISVPLEPKGIHDEMNSATFDEFGRMTANLGLEAPGATPLLQNIILYPYVNPPTEIIDATNLPKGDIDVKPISVGTDGTQIWKITHNGVDTHPIHWHLYDVQVLNRVTWDNIIIPPDPAELGWKETLRVSPLEDTIVAIRPIVPTLPFEVPNSIRNLNPMMPTGDTSMFNPTDAAGNPTSVVSNILVNFGWEYVYHCHILSHEEMDMMRPVTLAVPPIAPDNLSYSLSGTDLILNWNDNSITETAFVVQRNDGGVWTDVTTIDSPLDAPNIHEARSYTDTGYDALTTLSYRVVALNEVGYGGQFMSLTVKSVSPEMPIGAPVPAAPTNLTANVGTVPVGGLQAGGVSELEAVPEATVDALQVTLNWTDNSIDETSFVVERSSSPNLNMFQVIATLPANTVTYTDASAPLGAASNYRVKAVNNTGSSPYSNIATIVIGALPAVPSGLTATLQAGPQISLAWKDVDPSITGFIVERNINLGGWLQIATPAAGTITYLDTPVVPGSNYQYRVAAVNPSGNSAYSNIVSVAVPTLPADPTLLTATLLIPGPQVKLDWVDNATNEDSYIVERDVNGSGTFTVIGTLPAGTITYTDTAVVENTTYDYRIAAVNLSGMSAYATVQIIIPILLPTAPSGLSATLLPALQARLDWTDNATNETGFIVQRSTDNFVTFTEIAAPAAFTGTGAVSFIDPVVLPGTTYQYRVAAVNTAGPSAWTNIATLVVPKGPKAPTNLVASLRSGPRGRLNWVDNATGESGFIIERSEDGGVTFVQIATAPAFAGTGNVRWFDTSIVPGTTYDYRVAAFNVTGQSTYTNTANLVVPAIPAAPSNFTVVKGANNRTVILNWTDNSGTGFTIQRSNNKSFTNNVKTYTIAAGTTTFTQSNLSRGTKYFYRINSVAGTFVLSSWVNATPFPYITP